MNAVAAIEAPEALPLRVARRIERAGAGARAWYLATSALTGAVLYMGAAWPGAHPAIHPAVLPVASPTVEAPLAPQAITGTVEPGHAIAGTVLLEAVRAVGAASKTRLVAQSNQTGTTSSAGVSALSPVAATVATAVGAARSAGPPTANTASSATGAAVANPVSGTGQATTSLGGASVDTRQPPAPQSAGPNRIAVPGGQVQPVASAGAGPAAPGPSTGANRIATPPANPQR